MVATLLVDLEFLNGILDFSISSYRFSTSCFVRFGGSEGNAEASKTGAIILDASIEGVLDAEVLDVRAVPFDNADIEDTFDPNEDTDSVESRLVNCCPEGLLGGRAGETCERRSRGGSRGGAGGFGLCETAWPVRVIVGGGRTPSRWGPSGSLPIPFLESVVWLEMGGTLAVLLLSKSGLSELSSFVPDGVPGALPRCPTLRAAIRACIDCT